MCTRSSDRKSEGEWQAKSGGEQPPESTLPLGRGGLVPPSVESGLDAAEHLVGSAHSIDRV